MKNIIIAPQLKFRTTDPMRRLICYVAAAACHAFSSPDWKGFPPKNTFVSSGWPRARESPSCAVQLGSWIWNADVAGCVTCSAILQCAEHLVHVAAVAALLCWSLAIVTCAFDEPRAVPVAVLPPGRRAEAQPLPPVPL